MKIDNISVKLLSENILSALNLSISSVHVDFVYSFFFQFRYKCTFESSSKALNSK
jgi:hypothetical protein